MSAQAQRLGPLSWQQDRLAYEPGLWLELFTEQIRLGYLRVRLRREGPVSAEYLAAILRRSPAHLLPDDPAMSGDPP